MVDAESNLEVKVTPYEQENVPIGLRTGDKVDIVKNRTLGSGTRITRLTVTDTYSKHFGSFYENIVLNMIRELVRISYTRTSKFAHDFFYNLKGLGEFGKAKAEASARALEFLYDPSKYAELDTWGHAFFSECADAKGIRARLIIAVETILSRSNEFDTSKPLKIFSMACGTARVTFSVAAKLARQGRRVRALALDIDPNALKLSEEIAKEYEIPTKRIKDDDPQELPDDKNVLIQTLRGNVFKTEEIVVGKFEFIEMMGLFEYIPYFGPLMKFLVRRYMSFSGGKPPETYLFADDLVRVAYDKLKVGGYLLLANMTKSRPQNRFFRRVIQWGKGGKTPVKLYQRDVGDVLEVIKAAGIPLEHVEVLYPENIPLYPVYVIQKPK